jgi:hypothetical protein
MKAMGKAGWSTTDTLLPEGKLWTESGRFDEEGHTLGSRMAERAHAGLRDVADRILQLPVLVAPSASSPTTAGCCCPEGCRMRRSTRAWSRQRASAAAALA